MLIISALADIHARAVIEALAARGHTDTELLDLSVPHAHDALDGVSMWGQTTFGCVGLE